MPFAVVHAKGTDYIPAMQPAVMLGLFSLGGGELIVVLAALLILFGAKKLPDLSKGLGQGIWRFRDSMDDLAHDAGRSVGGIYGKPAAQALTPDNQVAELYDPAILRRRAEQPTLRTHALRLLNTICLSIRSWFVRR